MTTPKTLSITLSDDLAQLVERKVASGEYADENEVVSEGLAYLRENDAALEHWLRTEVVASADAVQADPSCIIPADQIIDRIRMRYRRDMQAKATAAKDRS